MIKLTCLVPYVSEARREERMAELDSIECYYFELVKLKYNFEAGPRDYYFRDKAEYEKLKQKLLEQRYKAKLDRLVHSQA